MADWNFCRFEACKIFFTSAVKKIDFLTKIHSWNRLSLFSSLQIPFFHPKWPRSWYVTKKNLSKDCQRWSTVDWLYISDEDSFVYSDMYLTKSVLISRYLHALYSGFFIIWWDQFWGKVICTWQRFVQVTWQTSGLAIWISANWES